VQGVNVSPAAVENRPFFAVAGLISKGVIVETGFLKTRGGQAVGLLSDGEIPPGR
jgi:hypothetical protein